MADSLLKHAFSSTVGIAQLPSCAYPRIGDGADNPISQALRRLADWLGWSSEQSAFGQMIPNGARVLIKPNMVLHQNEGPDGMDCLVTHASLIRAAAEEALRTSAAEVLVGDAPIQGCDFEALVQKTGLDVWSRELATKEPRFKGVRDFRRTTCVLVHGVRVAEENLQSEDHFTLFNLGRESLLEPISDGENRFRVAWYDHRLMAKTHHPGKHEYLVAREVMDADVIINLPKLKTHKKAGVTCALKNLIGINGNKEYLPHHRIGGPKTGGDNYPDDGVVKRALEYVSDRQNVTTSYAGGMIWHLFFAVLARTSRYRGDRVGMDGSWSGNDTIWRTCLDLNRILLYGRSDGTMSEEIQRRVIHVADAVIAGQGNGPLAPQPLELGLLIGGTNAAAIDWIGAQLLAYDPEKISLVRHAFDQFHWAITNFRSSDVRLAGDLGPGVPGRLLAAVKKTVSHPIGWRDAAAEPKAKGDSREPALAGAAAEPWDA
ncbi:MAG: DUF362 domain-containing protein [Terriglobales bacterium]|jgi:uncharacterized protein (DUF362 family)